MKEKEAAASPYASDARGAYAGELVSFHDIIQSVDGERLNEYAAARKESDRSFEDGSPPFAMQDVGPGMQDRHASGRLYPNVSHPLALLTEQRTRMLLGTRMLDGSMAISGNVKAALEAIYANWEDAAHAAGAKPDGMTRIDVEKLAETLLKNTPKGVLCIAPGDLLRNRREHAAQGNAFWQERTPAAQAAGRRSFGLNPAVPGFLAAAAAGSLEKDRTLRADASEDGAGLCAERRHA